MTPSFHHEPRARGRLRARARLLLGLALAVALSSCANSRGGRPAAGPGEVWLERGQAEWARQGWEVVFHVQGDEQIFGARNSEMSASHNIDGRPHHAMVLGNLARGPGSLEIERAPGQEIDLFYGVYLPPEALGEPKAGSASSTS